MSQSTSVVIPLIWRSLVGNDVVGPAFEVAEGVGAGVPVREARVVADTGEGAGGVGEVEASCR